MAVRLPRNRVEFALQPGETVILPARVARHLGQVLRMQAGSELLLFNGRDGRECRARITRMDRKAIQAKILECSEAEPPPVLQLNLALGISRGERMDFALQKAVELGVTSITPLFSERTVVRLDAQRLRKRMAHWHGVITSACEQSGRNYLPRLDQAQDLPTWLKKEGETWTLLLDPRAGKTLPDLPGPPGRMTFLIGPEGGFSDRERSLAYASGCTGIRLGPRILRTETAPLAAMAAAQVLWGDFR